MARIKHVFRSYREVCERYFAQTQDWGRCRSLSFNDISLTSYSTHIARIHTRACDGAQVFLLDSERYSQTTNNHRGAAKYAANKARIPTICVDDISADHTANRDYFKRVIDRAIKYFYSARYEYGAYDYQEHQPKPYARNYAQQHYDRLCAEYRKYCEFFGLSIPPLLGLALSGARAEAHRKKMRDNRNELGIRPKWQRPDSNWPLRLPKWLAYIPDDQLEPKMLLKIRNADIRAEFIRRVGGIDRVINELGKTIDKQGEYELVLLNFGNNNRIRVGGFGIAIDMPNGLPYLKMHNPSVPELWHVEGVHPACESVADALEYRRYGENCACVIRFFHKHNIWYGAPKEIPNNVIWNPSRLT